MRVMLLGIFPACFAEVADELCRSGANMRPISPEGFERPKPRSAGPAPMLQWIQIADLVVDPTYQRPIIGKGRKNVDRIAREFSWSCFAPVVVSPVEGGKFAIIDGQHRTTAAALIGVERVPCQVVIAAREEQAAAFKAINGITTPISALALHAAALIAQEPWAVEVADVCARADVQLLRYPLPAEKQQPGQTMAVGAISHCLRRYGADTLITALQCVTETENNKPGVLSSRIIKALCSLLDENKGWRDSGLSLLQAFDHIDLAKIEKDSALEAATRGVGRGVVISEWIREAVIERMPEGPFQYLEAAE